MPPLPVPAPPTLAFRGGTIEVTGLPPGAPAPPECLWDPRTACFRAPASAYAAVRRAFGGGDGVVEDRARRYGELELGARVHREPRPYQSEALAAWRAHQGRGVVVLPTGAGKTWVARLAIEDLLALPLQRIPHRHLLERCWELRSNLTVSDASYVATAELFGTRLLTSDVRMSRSPGVKC